MSLFDEASLIVTPNAFKASKLYSIKPTDGSGDLSVVRATTATRVNSAGLIETVSANIPRLDYTNSTCPSILVEPQRANLLLNSQFNGAISGTPGTLPTSYLNIQNTGTLTVLTNPIGSKLGFITNGSNARAIQQSVSILSNTTYVYSLKAEVLTQNIFLQYMNVGLPSGATAQFVYNGTNVASNFLIPIGECNLQIIITNVNAGSLILRLGSGISGNTNGNIIIKEPQLEAGSNATSYIPTVASTVTRNADVISKTGISSLIGQTEGTIFIETQPLQSLISDGVARSLFSLNQDSLSLNLFYLRRVNNNYLLNVNSSGTTVATPTIFTYSNINLNKLKIAIKYGSNTLKVFVNGINTVNQTISSIPSTNTLTLGSNRVNGDILDGRIDLFQLYKTSLSDQECINLTTL